MALEYLGLADINGPLVMLEGVSGVSNEEMVQLRSGDDVRLGRVVSLSGATSSKEETPCCPA